MRKLFSIGLAISLALIIGLAGPAGATCSQWAANTQVQHNGYDYNAMKTYITVSTPYSPAVPNTHTNHWIGIDDGYAVAQTGYFWFADANGFKDLKFFWELYAPGNDTGAVFVATDPAGVYPGDLILFSMWYANSSYWGLQITDTTADPDINIYTGNVHPQVSGTAASFLGTYTEIATERASTDQLEDGTTTFKQAQGRNQQNNQYTWFQNEPTMTDAGLGNSTCGHFIESETPPNSNAYSYHTWQNPN